MPFFFFRSGLFASNTGWMDVLKKNAKRYLIPYVVWGIITFIAVIICQIYEGSISVQSLIIRPIKDTYIRRSDMVFVNVIVGENHRSSLGECRRRECV